MDLGPRSYATDICSNRALQVVVSLAEALGTQSSTLCSLGLFHGYLQQELQVIVMSVGLCSRRISDPDLLHAGRGLGYGLTVTPMSSSLF